MNSPNKDIATLLDGQSSLGLTLATDLFYNRVPASPDNCVVVMLNPGDSPMLTMKKATSDYFYSSVTVYVRNRDQDAAWTQIKSVMDYLHGHSNETVDGTLYTLIKALNDPQVLSWDDNDRVTLFVNFEVQRRDT